MTPTLLVQIAFVLLVAIAAYASWKRSVWVVISTLLFLFAIFAATVPLWLKAVNPDPNHTHADFAVWIDGEKLDFSGEQFMSGSSKDAEETMAQETGLQKYFHLHDGNGHVIHRHKPGLNIGQFLSTIGFGIASLPLDGKVCWYTSHPGKPFTACESAALRFFVNDQDIPVHSEADITGYVFRDGDMLLITDAVDAKEVSRERMNMTSDACRYSKTCPWKGKPPTENCIADPEVPCTE
jgi:hypothetical protein